MIEAVPNIASMAPYQLVSLDEQLVSLAQNESAFPPGQSVLEAAVHAMQGLSLYPDPDWKELRSSIASVHKLDTELLMCGAGSMELIGVLLHAFAGPNSEVIGSEFGYLFVATVCQQIGARYQTVDEEDYTVSVDRLLEAVNEKTRVVFVCNPGNPTGTCLSVDSLLRLREEMPAHCLLIIDQAYGEFDNQNHQPLFDLIGQGNTVITRTFSKAYCLAGLRVGWAYAPGAVIGECRKILNPNNISVLSQQAALAAMNDQVYLKRVVEGTAKIRDDFRMRLLQAGLSTPESQTNFVLLPFADRSSAQLIDEALKAKGYVIREMSGYGLAHCLRVTVGTPQQMQDVAEVIVKHTEQSV